MQAVKNGWRSQPESGIATVTSLSALSILMDGHGVDFGVPRKPQVDFGELGGIGEGKTA
jgi:hypothetical protein